MARNVATLQAPASGPIDRTAPSDARLRVTGSPPVLVLISEDPRVSHRANEALRIALGIVAGESTVTIVLGGPATRLLDEDTDGLVDGDDIAKFRAALRRLQIPFHVEAAARPADADWNAEGHPIVPVTAADVAALVAQARRLLVF